MFGEMVIIYTSKGMIYAKMFYGGMVLFSGGMASPLNSSTDYKVSRILNKEK